MEDYGGRDNFLEIYKGFYRDFFADPFMNVLFDLSHADTNVPPEEHGMRLGTFYLKYYGGEPDTYTKLRGDDVKAITAVAHQRAKNCPMRGHQKGKDFTWN